MLYLAVGFILWLPKHVREILANARPTAFFHYPFAGEAGDGDEDYSSESMAQGAVRMSAR